MQGLRSKEARPGLHILPLFSRVIFKSLWFKQEAIGQVFLGKVAFEEKSDIPSLGRITGALPCPMSENRALTMCPASRMPSLATKAF